MDCQVLVVGAGPTGLVLALWLTRLGVRVRIIDKTSAPGTTSRALAVQARTLELYRQLDLADTIVSRGHKVPAVNLWAKGAQAARLPFKAIGEGLTPYSFLEIFPQDEHERLLISRLRQLGVTVERETELLNFSDERSQVVARLKTPQGDERCETRFIAGCDGARSLVRETLKTGFPGGTYRQLFYVADIKGSGPAFNGELHVDLDEADFLAVFPLAGEGRARLIGTVRDERADRPDALRFEDVSARAIEHMNVKVETVNWFSTYHVHHRVTEHFRKGHAFLLGDAAHIHSPAGGQGMNTGIGDAINLAWKLAAVLAGRAPDRLLDSYEAERMSFARRLVATTDRAFTLVSAEGAFADLLRTRIAPFLLPKIVEFSFAREYLFRTVSQITLNYRDGPLSEGIAGDIRGGDRLPWVPFDADDNFSSLAAAMDWQLHVYGRASDALGQWARNRNVLLQQFAWREAFQKAGFMSDAAYLVRPDMYVAVAGATPDSLDVYFSRRGIRP
ncbi:MAG TPA: FAD-dependent monooxygenase [Rhizomicrobium sp.]|nr:FAD-dependent monooxygenase [Rhizomicrobium sp.]